MSDPFESPALDAVAAGHAAASLTAAPPPSIDPRISLESLEFRRSELAQRVAKAQAQHPAIALAPERFLPFLLRCLPEPLEQCSTEQLDALHIDDLYLACAYGLGIEAARVQIEQDHFDRIARRLQRSQTPPAIIDDILQELRCRLVEMQSTDFSGRAYSGRGSLGGWLFIAAIRIAERRVNHRRQELPESATGLLGKERLAMAVDPEMEHLMQSYKTTFEDAMRSALAAMSSRERNLLRYHFVERLSIDRLAELYKVHRATAARWIVRAQQHLAEETRARFAAQIPVAADSMPRLLAMVRSKLDLSLSAVLPQISEAADAAEAELES